MESRAKRMVASPFRPIGVTLKFRGARLGAKTFVYGANVPPFCGNPPQFDLFTSALNSTRPRLRAAAIDYTAPSESLLYAGTGATLNSPRKYRWSFYSSATAPEPFWTSGAVASQDVVPVTVYGGLCGIPAQEVNLAEYVTPKGVVENGRSYWWSARTVFQDVDNGPEGVRWEIRIQQPAVVPTLVTPEDGGAAPTVVQSLTPALEALSGPPSSAAPVSYQFEVATDATFTANVRSSGNFSLDPSFAVPLGWLSNDTTYYWRSRARNRFGTSGWSLGRAVRTNIPMLGRGTGARWDQGPISVNLKTGNLVLDLPGPSYPTAAGSLSLAATYNSQNPTTSLFGPGISMSLPSGAGEDAAPVKLIDHNLLPDTGPKTREDLVEILGGDGWSEFYYPGGDGLSYYPEERGGSVLKKRGERTQGGTNPAPWTLTQGGDAVYTFDLADSATGEAAVLSSEVAAGKKGQARLIYRVDTSGRLIAVVDPSGRALTLDWAGTAFCTDAILCVSLRDDTDTPAVGQQKRQLDSVVWKYQGAAASRAVGPLERIVRDDGTATKGVVQLGWSSGLSPVIVSVKDANTLNAPAGHNGVYSTILGYDTPSAGAVARVTSLDRGPVSGQVPPTSRWSLAYNPVGVSLTTNPTQRDHSPYSGVAQARVAAGVTVITAPNGGQSSTWFDSTGNPLQSRDPAGRISQTGWSEQLQVWREDPTGEAKDTTYDTINRVPIATAEPATSVTDEAGTTITRRPTTQIYYDEAIPTTTASQPPPGNYLWGLRGDYYDNRNLAGRPFATRTDPAIDFDWAAAGYPAPLQGATDTGTTQITDNFSVRWSGTLDLANTTSADYVFTASADGGVRISIDGVLVVTRWADPGGQAALASDSVTLAPGRHRLEVSYFDGKGSPAGIALKFRLASGPPTSDTVLPSAVLRPNYLNVTSTVSPTGRRSFSHFAEPWRGLRDYTFTRAQTAPVQDIVTSYTYDELGRPATKTVPRGNTGRLDPTTWTLSGTPDPRFTTTWVYYGLVAGEPQPATADIPACNGVPASLGVFQGGNLKEKRVPGRAVQSLIYDATGRLRSETKARGRACNTYTTDGWLASRTSRADSPGLAETTTYTYDAAGNVLAVSTPGKGTITSQYDEAGRTTRSLDSFATPPPAPPGTATDVTAPTVVVTSPAPSSVVGDAGISVAAEAADDVNVVGVQFKLDGQNLGPEDTRPPFRALWDASQAAPGTRILTAVARDASGKSTTSVPVSVTNNSACAPLVPRAGLVSYYDFNENTGSIVTDRAGAGNNGSITGAIWTTTSRCGSALEFNATNSSVAIPDANSLDLTTGMTVEAWVRRTSNATGFRTLLEKEAPSSYSYSLRTDGGSKPEGKAKIGTADAPVTGSTAMPLNTWTHVAAVYNGTAVTLYVNGVQAATNNRSGTITPSAGLLRLGWSATRPAERFVGQMDDVRVYNRALTPGEIQGDMGALSFATVGTVPATDDAAESRVSYDAEGNVTARTTAPGAISAGQAQTTRYTYNQDGSLGSHEIRAFGATTAGDVYTYSYDTRGVLKGIQYPNAVAYTWRTYNAAGWLTGLHNRHGVMPSGVLQPATGPAADTSPIADYTYARDADGHIVREQLAFDAAIQTRNYSYDGLGRIARYTTPTGLLREYRYDSDSNRTEVLETPNGGTQATVASYTYDAGTLALPTGLDQLTNRVQGGQTSTYTYHPDGELRLEAIAGTTRRDLSAAADWNGEGVLVSGVYSATRVSVTLDPNGATKARGSQGLTTEYPGGIYERSGGRVAATTLENLALYTSAAPTGSKSYLCFNGHGDLAATLNSAGLRQGPVLTYEPFGQLEDGTPPPSDATVERYLGQRHLKLDTRSALVTMGARAYDPVLGRFLSVDLVEGGALNGYDYANQDPIANADADGHVVIGPDGGGCFDQADFNALRKPNDRLRMSGYWLLPSPCAPARKAPEVWLNCKGKNRTHPLCRKGDSCAVICRTFKKAVIGTGRFIVANGSEILQAGQACVEYGFFGAAWGTVIPVVGTTAGGIVGCATGASSSWYFGVAPNEPTTIAP
jgi:RHS repeat-associated protein